MSFYEKREPSVHQFLGKPDKQTKAFSESRHARQRHLLTTTINIYKSGLQKEDVLVCWHARQRNLLTTTIVNIYKKSVSMSFYEKSGLQKKTSK